ncbi:MAG: hypothetical protein ABDI20_03045, partial [Candidatus Bipolaricaulaceae bacterium]
MADDNWGGRGYGTLVIWILRPLRVYGSAVTVSRGGMAWGSLYVDDGDPSPIRPDFVPVTLEFRPPPGISVVERPEIQPSGLGTYVPVEVNVERSLCPGTYPVPFTAKHLDGRTASGTLTVTVVGNRPPQASPPELRGETTVALTPGGLVRRPVVFQPIAISDPDGDPVVLEGYGIPPTYAANLSAFLGSLVAMYTPGSLTEEALCAAVRNRDVFVDTFSLTLRDACGARTEVPVRVTIKVEDKIPPKIITPARDKVVECDGKGNVEDFQAWLESRGGAWAFDTCCGDVTWRPEVEKYEPLCGRGGRYTVKFIAIDCAGNKAETKATFTIVDTQPPKWDQDMPGDAQVECSALLKVPEITASDT